MINYFTEVKVDKVLFNKMKFGGFQENLLQTFLPCLKTDFDQIMYVVVCNLGKKPRRFLVEERQSRAAYTQ